MKTHKFEVEVQNISDGALEYPYMIVRYADGGIWYYGVDVDANHAKEWAESLGNGFVIENKEVK